MHTQSSLPSKAVRPFDVCFSSSSCAEKVTCKKGEELYAKSRDELKVMLGNSGVRLYSQLQADRSRVSGSALAPVLALALAPGLAPGLALALALA